MNRSKKVAKNTIYRMLFRLVTVFSSFAIRTTFIYTLGDEYTGLSSLFKSVLTVLSFVDLGIGTSISFALYKPIAHKDNHKIAQLLKVYRTSYTIIGITIFVLGSSLVPFLDKIVTDVPNIKENITLIYLWQLLNTSLSYFLVYRITLLTASQQDHLVSKLSSVMFVLRTIAEIVVLAVFKSYWGYLLVNSLYTLSKNITLTLYSRHKIKLPHLEKGDVLPKEEKKSIFKNVGALAIYKISDVALEGTDSIIISSMISTGLLGIYSNYYLLMTTVKYAVDQVFSSSIPSIGNFKEFSDNKGIEGVMNKLTFLAFWLATFCTAAFICLIDDFISNIWLDSSRVLPFSIVLTIFIEFYICLMTRPSRTIRESCGLFVQGKYRPLVMAIINIVSSILLTKYFGLIGVILGTVIARASTQFWFDPYIIYKKLFKSSAKNYLLTLLKYIVISTVICSITFFITELFAIKNVFVSFVVKMLTVIIIPNTILFILYRNNENFKWLAETFSRLFLSKIIKKFSKN